jgi:hypothetical protein
MLLIVAAMKESSQEPRPRGRTEGKSPRRRSIAELLREAYRRHRGDRYTQRAIKQCLG